MSDAHDGGGDQGKKNRQERLEAQVGSFQHGDFRKPDEDFTELDEHEAIFTFVLSEGEQHLVRTNKQVLADRSDVFKALFYGPLKTKGRIAIADSTFEAFKIFIETINRGNNLGILNTSIDLLTILEIYKLALRYQTPDIATKCTHLASVFEINRKNFMDVVEAVGKISVLDVQPFKTALYRNISKNLKPELFLSSLEQEVIIEGNLELIHYFLIQVSTMFPMKIFRFHVRKSQIFELATKKIRGFQESFLDQLRVFCQLELLGGQRDEKKALEADIRKTSGLGRNEVAATLKKTLDVMKAWNIEEKTSLAELVSFIPRGSTSSPSLLHFLQLALDSSPVTVELLTGATLTMPAFPWDSFPSLAERLRKREDCANTLLLSNSAARGWGQPLVTVSGSDYYDLLLTVEVTFAEVEWRHSSDSSPSLRNFFMTPNSTIGQMKTFLQRERNHSWLKLTRSCCETKQRSRSCHLVYSPVLPGTLTTFELCSTSHRGPGLAWWRLLACPCTAVVEIDCSGLSCVEEGLTDKSFRCISCGDSFGQRFHVFEHVEIEHDMRGMEEQELE